MHAMTAIARPLRCLLAVLLALLAAPALAAPPTDADINRLLAASRAQSLLEGLLPQMEAMQQQQFDRLLAGNRLEDAQRQRVLQVQERTRQALRRLLSWPEMRPLYLDLYKRTFSREDVLAMAEFYESPAGQSLLDKTPLLMQNLMVAIQQKIQPQFAELEAELRQAGTAPAPPPTGR
ncbi:DUF2059 domain-containing protein [Xanthomonas massiliensis]|uniref:DUF2059 domain-containing protein n=1 Tax=Xanthomonas massiliensis TaxID=1720302 RepID=UPI0011C7EF3C|nr:DUF2059 domain-containing protein [Xanthomonas massiliensis]